MNKNWLAYRYTNFIFFLFSFTFFSPALSPFVNGVTIYLSWFVPFLDINFDLELFMFIKKKIPKRAVMLFIIFLFLMIAKENILAIAKIISIIYTIYYINYAYKKVGFNMMYTAMNVNIIIALFQFILCFINTSWAYYIGPTNISKMIWGSLATKTNTNFYTIFFFPRTCGLSRESGFFASILSVMWLVYINDKNIKKSKYQNILYMIGYICSFSKMSFFFPILYIVYKLKNYINKNFSYYSSIFTISVSLIIISHIMNNTGFFDLRHITWAHRFGGYYLMPYYNLQELLIGNSDGIQGLNSYAASKLSLFNTLFMFYGYELCGLPQIVISFGSIGLIVYLMFMKDIGLKTSGLIFLLIATFNVDLFTATSFVVMSYWFAIFAMNEEK